MCLLIRLRRRVNHSERINPIEFGDHRWKFKVTMDIYIFRNRLVNTIETEPLCAYSSNLADMLTMVRGWTLLILEVTGQRWKSPWASFTNVGCARMLGFALLYFLCLFICPSQKTLPGPSLLKFDGRVSILEIHDLCYKTICWYRALTVKVQIVASVGRGSGGNLNALNYLFWMFLNF